jgi:octaheme c-type cytochrome (tetrathionate reductase family)
MNRTLLGGWGQRTLLVTAGLAVGLTIGGCPPPAPPTTDNGDATQRPRHETIFTEVFPDGFEHTDDCLTCHPDEADEVLDAGHWGWTGVAQNIVGFEGEMVGKSELLNNFCIAVPSNEGRCTQCHPSFGWRSSSFDFNDASNIDCLVCHDTTGTYVKDPTKGGGGGLPADGVDLQLVAENVGKPNRQNCGFCHFSAGGGDNVKHGDLASSLVDATFEVDVHMNVDGTNFSCQVCHTAHAHKIAGTTALHTVDEGEVACADCHSARDLHASNTLNNHMEKVACQACHIPTFARQLPTKVEWYWSEAGQDIDPIPTDQYGKATYDKKKGRFVWAKNVVPTLMWFNGTYERMIVGLNDTFTETPAVLGKPVGSKDDPDSKLTPFKKMIGDQVADANAKRILVPHLFGMAGGPNPYWGKFDWDLALQDGAAATGVPYSGDYEFVDTVMYLSINHEVAPAEEARGCNGCHNGGIDWQALGYAGDPIQ